MLEEVFSRGWENFLARTEGPMSLRFVIQPMVATFLAIRAGLRDAEAGRPAFFWSLLTQNGSRALRLGELFKDVGKVFILALTLDAIYQLIVLRGIYLLELVFTAVSLAIVPYLLIRGPLNRIARTLKRVPPSEPNET